jgi:hypothetical protein
VDSELIGSQLASWRDIGDSQQGHEAVNTEVDGSTALEAVTRQAMNTEQTKKI